MAAGRCPARAKLCMLAPVNTMPENNDPFVEKVRGTLAAHDMIPAGGTVLAAVSGGADSLALAHVLRLLGIPFALAHFDHQTRAGASTEDAAFVRDLAGAWGVRFHETACPVAEHAAETGESFEQAARRLRYTFLLDTARAHGFEVVATGHHRDDQVETVLMRFLRGSGRRGLAGIPPVRQKEHTRIVRPLLDCTRTEIEAWLAERGIRWRTDVTNADTAYPRNRVRHALLPLLRDGYNAAIDDVLVRLADTMRVEDDLLDALTRDALARCETADGALDRTAFARLHSALRRRCVLRLARRHGVEPTHARVTAAAEFVSGGSASTVFELGEGLRLCNAAETTHVLSGPAPAPEPVELAVPGEAQWGHWRFRARLLEAPPRAPLAQYCTPKRQVFDAETAGDMLAVRSRRNGDRFRPLGMNGEKKLKDYFNDLGIAAPLRAQCPLLCRGEEVLWVVGHAPARDAAVTPATTGLLEVEVWRCD